MSSELESSQKGGRKPALPPEIAEAAAKLPVRDFEGALIRLCEADARMLPGDLLMLSGASPAETALWREAWSKLDQGHRRKLAEHLLEAAERDIHIDIRPLFRELIEDSEPEIRVLGIEGLWEATELGLIERFATILREDSSDRVRARAAAVLGSFIELGELRRSVRPRVAPVLDLLLDLAADEREDPDLRRHALASAGYAEHPDLAGLIEAALASELIELQAGALRAMGNSADEDWGEEVLSWLDEDEPELRFEAIHAAGELALVGAVPQLSSIARFEEDRALRAEAIWSLGEIGGKAAHRILEAVAADVVGVDEDLAEAVEEALASCALIEGSFGMPLDPAKLALGGASDGDDEDEDLDDEDFIDDLNDLDDLDDLDVLDDDDLDDIGFDDDED
jgi:HEAT repeat protein